MNLAPEQDPINNDTQAPRERWSYLGGHDIAAIVGASPYAGPYDVFLKKYERLVDATNEAMDWGLRLEEPVAMKYADITGIKLFKPDTIFHGQYPFLGGSPDFFTMDEPDLMLEIKTASEDQLQRCDENGAPMWGEEGTDEIPANYLVQVQYYMGLCGKKRTDLAVFFLGARRIFKIYKIEFDPEFYALLIKRGVEFWKIHIETGTPPAVEVHPSELVTVYLAKKALKGGLSLPIPDELARIARELEGTSGARGILEDQEEALKARLLEAMAKLGTRQLKGSINVDGKPVGYSLGISGGDEEGGAPIILWKEVAEELSKRLNYPKIPETLIEQKSLPAKCRKPHLRAYWTAVRRARNAANQ